MPTPLVVCVSCRRFDRDVRDRNVCTAFPDGIPAIIWDGTNNHTQPVAGDHGLRFDPFTEADAAIWRD